MFPTLPQLDPKAVERETELLTARHLYRYDYTYPPGIAMAQVVPEIDGFSKRYLADVIKVNLALAANHVAADLDGTARDRSRLMSFDLPGALAAGLQLTHRFRVGAELGLHPESYRPDSLGQYERLFSLIPRPPIVAVAYSSDSQNSRAQNLAFAWQRLAGANPMELVSFAQWSAARGTRGRMPDAFPLDETAFRRAMQTYAPFTSEERSLAEHIDRGSLYVADYAPLAALPSTSTFRGRQRYIAAPIALFATIQPAQDELPEVLVPVAIQCGQTPDQPLLTPADGWAWVRARCFVQIADGNIHEAVRHLAETHLIMESVILAAKRCLAQRHPLRVLLDPHFEFTLALNDVAKHNLIAPGGSVDMILAPPLAAALEAVRQSIQAHDLRASVPTRALPKRGFGDGIGPQIFPYRDDALRLYPAIEGFVRDYVRLYYDEDADVTQDTELRSFLAELTEHDPKRPGGRLSGVLPIDDVPALSELMAAIVWTASAQHACLNFAQFPYMGLVPNMPGSAYAPPPTGGEETEQLYLDTLPPLDVAEIHFNLAYELSSVRENRLGDYPRNYFTDPRARELAVAFRRRLDRIDSEIAALDATRPLPYPYLRPSVTPASIHI
ncbi:MAG: lipoxygenase family protein [Polyangiaceae bacterium]